MTDFGPGDQVRIRGKSYLPHAFPVGALVTLTRPGGRFAPGRWNVVGPHPRQPGRQLSQLVDERDFVLVTPARRTPRVQSVQEQAEAVQDAEAAAPEPTPALPPHPESIPVPEPQTDKAVLAPYYMLADDEAIRKAILNLQFELTQRDYRKPENKRRKKANADV